MQIETEKGCLSFTGVRRTTRCEEVEVEHQGMNFKKQKGKFNGWTAQIIQHEVDHCQGRLTYVMVSPKLWKIPSVRRAWLTNTCLSNVNQASLC